MESKVTTKFNIGDEVWFLQPDGNGVNGDIIQNIQVISDISKTYAVPTILYKFRWFEPIAEDHLFLEREAAVKVYNKYLEDKKIK